MDLVYFCFCLGGTAMILRSVWLLWKEGQVHGVSMLYVLFFMLWAGFNYVYFMAVRKPYPAMGSLLMAIADVVYLIQIFDYRRRQCVNQGQD